MINVEGLLEQMITLNASDLFISEGRSPALRIDGSIKITNLPIVTRDEMQEFLNAVLRPSQKDLFAKTGDLDVGFSFPRLGRFRGNFLIQRGLIASVIRRIPSGRVNIEALGLPASIRTLVESPRGIVLIVGSSGNGKSTTLAGMVHYINSRYTKHIVTLEDPIEFVHDDVKSIVTQREIGSDSKDFSVALRHVLRESPDVIVIGELRDTETLDTAISAALTGHLVLSTLHTIDAAKTLQRILSMYPSDDVRTRVALDLSIALQGIVAQRLIPRLDGNGRVMGSEVLIATPPVRKLLREQRINEIHDIIASSVEDGMITFDRTIATLCEREVISLESGLSYATSQDAFLMHVHGIDSGASSHKGSIDEKILEGVANNLDIKVLITWAIRYGASDIHLVAGVKPTYRIHGSLTTIGNEPLTSVDIRRLLFSVLSNTQREQFELERELDFALAIGSTHRFRVNAHYQKGTIAISLRLIPNDLPHWDSLKIPNIIRELSMKAQGLVLIAGPTGSGKSTTLASMIDVINSRRNCHIITIEEPIEFIHQNKMATVEQRDVGVDTKSFSAALKYILRQDPDVILVGEMRDVETISAALTAAETGHLVLATIHTNDAPQTIDRIVDVFPPYQHAQIRAQLAGALLAVISQRLLLKTDNSGRVAAFEILVATPAVRSIIREGKNHQLLSVMETASRDGMITMDKWLLELVRLNQVSIDEAIRYVRNPSIFSRPQPTPITPQQTSSLTNQQDLSNSSPRVTRG